MVRSLQRELGFFVIQYTVFVVRMVLKNLQDSNLSKSTPSWPKMWWKEQGRGWLRKGVHESQYPSSQYHFINPMALALRICCRFSICLDNHFCDCRLTWELSWIHRIQGKFQKFRITLLLKPASLLYKLLYFKNLF